MKGTNLFLMSCGMISMAYAASESFEIEVIVGERSVKFDMTHIPLSVTTLAGETTTNFEHVGLSVHHIDSAKDYSFNITAEGSSIGSINALQGVHLVGRNTNEKNVALKSILLKSADGQPINIKTTTHNCRLQGNALHFGTESDSNLCEIEIDGQNLSRIDVSQSNSPGSTVFSFNISKDAKQDSYVTQLNIKMEQSM
ncbi:MULTISPECIES: hypothetical protein [Cysteiniphilum]|uniref:hypothetical protein n=1 Tax=Cysteiniphilum TaxID=2056696 RepID=UPI00177B9AEC|nr:MULTISPECIES: hypothetical protein [Cysteiniphilum]